MTEQNNTSKTLLHSFLIITHALELQPNSNPYRELKHRMNPEELIVLQHMQKQISAKNIRQTRKRDKSHPTTEVGGGSPKARKLYRLAMWQNMIIR